MGPPWTLLSSFHPGSLYLSLCPSYFFLASVLNLKFSHLLHCCWTASFFLWHCTQRIWVQDADVIEYQFQCIAARRISPAMGVAEVEEVFITRCNTGNVLHKPLSVPVSTWKCWESLQSESNLQKNIQTGWFKKFVLSFCMWV